MRVEEYFKNYTKFMLYANIGAIVYFFYALILNVVLKGDDLFRFTIMSASLIIGVIVSGLCFADFFSLEVEYYEIRDTEKELSKRVFLHKYWISFLKYVGINYAIGFSGIVINTVYYGGKGRFFKTDIPTSIKWFVLLSIVLSIIFLIGAGIIDLHEKKLKTLSKLEEKKKRFTFVSPLPLVMLAGGEDLLTYLIFILWIVIFIIPAVKKEKLSKEMVKELWKRKQETSDQFMKSFSQATSGKEIVLQAYPYFMIPFLFSYIMNDQLNIGIQTLMIVNILVIYYGVKSLREKSKLKIPFVVEIFMLTVLTFLYLIILNEQKISIVKTATLISIMGYEIKNYTVAVIIFGVVLYAFVILMSTLLLKLKGKKEAKVLLSVIISDIELLVVPMVLFSYLVIQRNSINYIMELFILASLYTIVIFLLTFTIKARNEVKLLEKIAQQHNFDLLSELSKGYCKFSISAKIFKKKLKHKKSVVAL